MTDRAAGALLQSTERGEKVTVEDRSEGVDAELAVDQEGLADEVVCEACGYSKEVSVNRLRQKLPPFAFVKQVGLAFRCQQCKHKGAEVDARRALGYMD